MSVAKMLPFPLPSPSRLVTVVSEPWFFSRYTKILSVGLTTFARIIVSVFLLKIRVEANGITFADVTF